MRCAAAFAILLALAAPDDGRADEAAKPLAGQPVKPDAKDTSGKDTSGKDAAAKDAPAAKVAAPEPWVREVHAVVVRAMAPLSRTLPRGAYAVRFSIDEQGRGSRYGVEGDVGAAQAAAITAALAAHAFPSPPDGASHAMSFTVRVK